MKAYTTYQLRAYTTKGGYKRLNSALVLCAKLYNKWWWERREAYGQYRIKIRRVDQTKQFTRIRNNSPEWGSMSICIGRGVARRVDRAFTSYFRRVQEGKKPGYPRPKQEHRYRCIEPDLVYKGMVKKSEDGRRAYVRIKGLPVLTLRTNRQLPPSDQLVGIRVVKRPVGWYVDLSYKVTKEPLEFSDESVGIDMGVNKRTTQSDGEIMPRRKLDHKYEKDLQHKIEKANKGSYKRYKLRRTHARYKYREQIRNRNECHRYTTDVIRQYELIAIEGIRWENLTKSPHGTIEKPGTNIAQKSGLNRSILEQTPGLIRFQLHYKAEWASRMLIEVSPAYTSQTCSRCSRHRETPLPNYEVFECDFCGLVLDRDINAAINILERAFEMLENMGRDWSTPEMAQNAASSSLSQ